MTYIYVYIVVSKRVDKHKTYMKKQIDNIPFQKFIATVAGNCLQDFALGPRLNTELSILLLYGYNVVCTV